MVKLDDALELLLPGADAALARRARDTVQFLRLLVADGRGEPAGRVGVDFERARGDLEDNSRRDLRAALTELLRQHLAHACGPETFAWFGTPRTELQSAWTLLTEVRAEFEWLPALPAPGESACSVAARVLAAAERFEAGAREWELWRARLARAELGPRVGEEAFRRGLQACLSTPALWAADGNAWLAGLCECLLDRGAPREARVLLQEQRDRVGSDARLCQLLGWCRLLLGDLAGARALLAVRHAPDCALPGPLHAWRARHPECPGLLPQRFVDSPPASSLQVEAWSGERQELGASVCVVLELDAQAGLLARRAELAPALRGGLDAWLAAQRHAPQEAGSLQQRLLLENRVLVVDRRAEPGLGEVLGGEQTLAVALVPLGSPGGERCAWVHLEFEHQLVPREERLLCWARAAAQRSMRPAQTEVATSTDAHPSTDAALFEELVEHLGLRGGQRRWWGFRVCEGRTELSAEGGEALPGVPDRPAGQALLGRVRLAGGHLGFEGPDPVLALRSSSLSGVALALRSGGRVLGMLAVESPRPKDFRLAELAAQEPLLASAALRLRVDAFRAWHREHYGEDLWFDTGSADFLAFGERFLRAAESDCRVLIAGPAGCGKSVLARWMHCESSRSKSALIELRSSALASESAWRATLARARGATLLVEDVERLDAAAAERLVDWLDASAAERSSEARPRLIATVATAPETRAGGVAAGSTLERHLEAIRFDIPPLRARRAEILPLVACFSQRHAGEEGLRVPSFDDGALALLWRQAWDGNLRELAGAVHRALLFAAGRWITSADLDLLTARFGRTLARRLPSRHPARSDLVGALRTTLLGSGRVNKTRAAVYLGWDPDTLVARLDDLGIDATRIPTEGAWDSVSNFAQASVETSLPTADASDAG